MIDTRHVRTATHCTSAGVVLPTADQHCTDTQRQVVGGRTFEVGQGAGDTHRPIARFVHLRSASDLADPKLFPPTGTFSTAHVRAGSQACPGGRPFEASHGASAAQAIFARFVHIGGVK